MELAFFELERDFRLSQLLQYFFVVFDVLCLSLGEYKDVVEVCNDEFVEIFS